MSQAAIFSPVLWDAAPAPIGPSAVGIEALPRRYHIRMVRTSKLRAFFRAFNIVSVFLNRQSQDTFHLGAAHASALGFPCLDVPVRSDCYRPRHCDDRKANS